jgi:hypothetical protein
VSLVVRRLELEFAARGLLGRSSVRVSRKLGVIMRFFWLATLCVFISGCATYRPASVPVAEPGTEFDEATSSILEGDTARIALHSGKKVSGKVLWLSSEKLALDRGGNYDNEELVIGISEIDQVEIRNQSDGQIEKRWFLSLGAAAVVATYVALRNAGF